MMFVPFLQGLGIGLSLIVAIGPQNAFLLKQGLQHRNLLLIASFCTIIDSILIIIGVAGFSSVLSSHPIIISIAKWFGVTFLFIFGLKSFYAAIHPLALSVKRSSSEVKTIKKTIWILAGLSLLNPHAYLDILLIGSLASQHDVDERFIFALGAVLASAIWFFTLTYGARLLRPFFTSKLAWKILDLAIGIIMWLIALTIAIEV